MKIYDKSRYNIQCPQDCANLLVSGLQGAYIVYDPMPTGERCCVISEELRDALIELLSENETQ